MKQRPGPVNCPELAVARRVNGACVLKSNWRYDPFWGKLLQRNMPASLESLQLGLEDLLGEMYFARRSGDLGRLALLAYCEVRRWARVAGEQALADQSSGLIHNSPHANRDEFIARIDALIDELENARERVMRRLHKQANQLDFESTAPGSC